MTERTLRTRATLGILLAIAACLALGTVLYVSISGLR